MNIRPDSDLKNLITHRYIDYSKMLLISKNDILGNVAKWSIRQSPFDIPPNLEIVLDKLNDHISIYFEKLEDSDLGFISMNFNELKNFINGNLITIKEFKNWNLSEMEKRIGIDIDDNRGDYCNQIVSIYSDVDPIYDFIDLDALIRNVCVDIYYSN